MLSRRGFIIATGVGLSGVVGLRLALTSDADAIAAVLRKRLNYLDLDEAGVLSFARDLARTRIIATGKLRLAAAVGLLDFEPPAIGYFTTVLHHGEERVVTAYLLSTDFFLSGADEARKVRYLGYYDPFKDACLNPFPRFAPNDEAVAVEPPGA